MSKHVVISLLHANKEKWRVLLILFKCDLSGHCLEVELYPYCRKNVFLYVINEGFVM
jgi:hypothetical protein